MTFIENTLWAPFSFDSTRREKVKELKEIQQPLCCRTASSQVYFIRLGLLVIQIRLLFNSDLKSVLITAYKHMLKATNQHKSLRSPPKKPKTLIISDLNPRHERKQEITTVHYFDDIVATGYGGQSSIYPRGRKTHAWKKNVKKGQSPATLMMFLGFSYLWHVELPSLK